MPITKYLVIHHFMLSLLGSGICSFMLNFIKKLRPSVYFFKQYSQLGFSYTEDTNNGLPTTQADVADDLYEFLVQFFTVFDSYKANDFYAFGESYGGTHTEEHISTDFFLSERVS